MDDIYSINLLECPICGGAGLLEIETGRYIYVSCMDCAAHTAEFEFKSPEQRFEAAQRAADLWNMGKVTTSDPGE